MYSVNVPVPDEVARLATGLATTCLTADARTRHSLVCKRLDGDERAYPRLARRVREALDGAPAFAARVTGVDSFDRPTAGRAPVAYLAVESPGLWSVHRDLCAAFDAKPRLEGDDYTPHVTIARGGDAGQLVGRDVDPVEWDVTRLELWDDRHREVVESVSLPA